MTRRGFASSGAAVCAAVSLMVVGLLISGVGRGPGTALAAPDARAGSPRDTASYAIGYDLARTTLGTLQQDQVEHDVESLAQGFLDALRGNAPAISEQDMKAALTRLEREVANRLARERLENDPAFAALADRNAKQSARMIEDMSQQPGAKKLDGGIWRIVLREGDGEPPKRSDTVTVTFNVRTADNRLVVERVGSEVRVSELIEGGQRALMQMSPGSRWLICIPAEHAFGLGGLAPDIGPNQALLVDCTLERVHR